MFTTKNSTFKRIYSFPIPTSSHESFTQPSPKAGFEQLKNVDITGSNYPTIYYNQTK